MLLQMTIDTSGIITMIILIFVIAVNLLFFLKMRIFFIILGIFFYSIYLCYNSLIVEMPMTPYFQNFFMLIQFLIFVATAIDTTGKKGRK